MPLMPIQLGGKLRLVNLPAGADSKEQYQAEEENLRRLSVQRRRLYYDGAQYDQENLEVASSRGIDLLVSHLPEHDRKHAYSTHIADSIDFIADQIAESFAMEAEDAGVQSILEMALIASDQFTGEGDEDEIAIDDVLRDALIAGDVAIEVKWDPIGETVFYEVWESEQVQVVYETRSRYVRVIREEIIWVDDVEGPKQVVQALVYEVVLNEFGENECRRQEFWDDEEEPRETLWLALPFIPWVIVPGEKKSLRATRGESVITDQCMEHVDRYNANEQNSYLIARYNSHGNLAVIGDAATLVAKQEEAIAKDVADVLSFPGGTALTTITLPTDPQMIEHQRKELAQAILQTFGLTRVEPETITSLGAVSGYALEILNRKTEGTFRRIRRNFSQGLLALFKMTLDVTAFRRNIVLVLPDGSPLPDDMPDEELEAILPQLRLDLASVDPLQVFPNRAIALRLGTGYIVDDAMVRADFVAQLISRAEALRRRGLNDDEIEEIQAEIEDEAPPEPELGAFAAPTSGSGSTVGNASRGGA